MDSKRTLAAATLLVAIPGGFLAFLLGTTFLTQLGNMPIMFTVLAAATLLACVVVVFLPFGVMIFGPKRAVAPKSATIPKQDKKSAAESGESISAHELEMADHEAEPEPELGMADVIVNEGSTGELDVVEGGMTRDNLGAVDVHLSEADMDAFLDEELGAPEKSPKKPKPR